MASVNKVILIGNLGKDPELRYNPSGVAFCTVTLATSRQWKNRETGERQEETEWHRVIFNDKLAEIVGQYCKKGKPIYVEGRLKTRKWQDKEGRDTYTTEVIADQMQLLGSREGGGDEGGGGGGGYSRENRGGDFGGGDAPAARAPARAPAAPRAPAAARPAPKSATGFDDMDDDIPF
jgi:single-strand DNA-binding protein